MNNVHLPLPSSRRRRPHPSCFSIQDGRRVSSLTQSYNCKTVPIPQPRGRSVKWDSALITSLGPPSRRAERSTLMAGFTQEAFGAEAIDHAQGLTGTERDARGWAGRPSPLPFPLLVRPSPTQLMRDPAQPCRSKRSSSITLAQARAKSWTNFSRPSAAP